jgi:hypothetical protein
MLRADDEDAHEAEAARVGNDGATADQLTVALGGNEVLGVGVPEYLGIV